MQGIKTPSLQMTKVSPSQQSVPRTVLGSRLSPPVQKGGWSPEALHGDSAQALKLKLPVHHHPSPPTPFFYRLGSLL